MSESPRAAYVVSHTHWDREWYLTFSEFRVMLERTVAGILDRLESDEAFEHFCLDGQAILLEDYLEVRPQDEARIRRLAEAGALSLGPFYVLPDEILIPPEASVRNLLLGHAVASRYGPVQPVGYLPDPFGHPAQLPQLLARSGIDAFVYTRGNGDEIDDLGLEFHWAAPDGSRVLAVHQLDGYCNAAALGLEELWHAHTPRRVDPARGVAKVRDLFRRMGERSRADVWLLNNGCDHHPAQRDLGAVLGALREAFPGTTFGHASLEAFVAALRAALPDELPTHEGELLGGRLHHVLSGVWSARMPLKQRNEEAACLLAGTTEPLLAHAHFLHGQAWRGGLLGSAWKLLLANQPHDSICGCSTDPVHREMLPRFDRVVQTSEQLARDALQGLVPTFGTTAAEDDDTVLAVFNPVPVRRRTVVERLVVLQPEVGASADALELVDEAGEGVPFEVIRRDRVERFWGVDYRLSLSAEEQRARFDDYVRAFGERILRPEDEKAKADTFLQIRFAAELPACGHALFRLRPRSDGGVEPPPAGVRVDGATLDNGRVGVALHPDGTLDLVDHRTGRHHAGLCVLRDVADVGDEYDFSPLAGDVPIDSTGADGRIDVVEAGRLAATLRARFVLDLPRSLEPDRKRRSDERSTLPVEVRVRLEADSPLVDLDVRIDNRSRDHRLRMLFPLAVATDEVVSDGHFLLDRRPLVPPRGDAWAQPHPGTYPQQGFAALESVEGGLAVLNRGLPEFQTTPRPDGGVDLAITLLRSVGWLSRDDFASRRCQNAGPTVPTPEAQCEGAHRFRLALVPFAGDLLTSGIADVSRAWRQPPLLVQGVGEAARRGGTGLVEKASPHVQVTAVKRHETRDTLVVRLVNLAGEPTVERLTFGLDLARAFTTDLLERRTGEPLRLASPRAVQVLLGPYEIVTLEVEAA